MERRKTPTAHTTEELLKTLEENEILSDKQELIIYPNVDGDVAAFLSNYKIEPGSDSVLQKVIFELYKRWSKEPVTKSKFENELCKYLIVHVKGPRYYYLINQKAMNLTQAAYKLVIKQTVDRTKSPPWKKHFESFLDKYEIKSGNFYVESFILYNLYDKYVYETGKKQPLGEDQFFNFCKLYLTNRRLTGNRVAWFGIDASIKKVITEETFKTLRESRVKHHAKKKKPKI